MTSEQVIEKRPVGRPATFPGQECELLTVSIPVETKEALRQEVKVSTSAETLNAIVNKAVTAFIRERNRKRTS